MRVLAECDGMFGPVRVLERRADGARLYCIKGSAQTMMRDGVSVFGYVHAAKLLIGEAKRVLIIGGAGGSLATMLARRNRSVTVIERDPVAEGLARRYFALDPRVRWRTADPFLWLETQGERFDAVIVDACDDEGLASPFDRPEILVELLDRAAPGGSLVLNLVHKDGAPAWGPALAALLAARNLSATLYRSEEGWEGNELLHVRRNGATDTLKVLDLDARPAETRTYLMSLRAHTPKRNVA